MKLKTEHLKQFDNIGLSNEVIGNLPKLLLQGLLVVIQSSD